MRANTAIILSHLMCFMLFFRRIVQTVQNKKSYEATTVSQHAFQRAIHCIGYIMAVAISKREGGGSVLAQNFFKRRFFPV